MKEPFLRIGKREDVSKKEIWIIRILAFFFALFLGSFIFLMAGANPFASYATIVNGALGKATGIRQTVKIMTPLLGAALALAPCFKMKYWNIGAEGQITIGAMGASFFAINYYDKMPSWMLLTVMGITGFVCGALWSMIPAFFKSKWNTNETLFTLMLNYIAIGIVAYLQGGPWEGKPGSQVIPNFKPQAVLPKVFNIYCGWIFILILVFVMYFYLNFTTHGYQIAVLGDSENTARYSGMDVLKITIRTAAISGGISGFVGFLLASGANQTLYSSVANGVGFTAITVAWLGQLNPFAMTMISFILAVLTKGSATLQTELGVPSSISGIITGILLLCLLGSEFFINYRLIPRNRKEQ